MEAEETIIRLLVAIMEAVVALGVGSILLHYLYLLQLTQLLLVQVGLAQPLSELLVLVVKIPRLIVTLPMVAVEVLL